MPAHPSQKWGRDPPRQRPTQEYPSSPRRTLFENLARLAVLHLPRHGLLIHEPGFVLILKHVHRGRIRLSAKIRHVVIVVGGEPAAAVVLVTP
jgi:hypothetical protein